MRPQKQQSPGDQTGDSTTERQNMNSIDDTSWAGLGPNYEMSAWMRGQVAKVMDDATRQLRARPERLSSVGTVVAPLGMKVHPPGSRADRECDRCGVYVPEGDDLVLISLPFRPRNPRHPWLRVFGGLCEACAAKESGPKRTVAGGAR